MLAFWIAAGGAVVILLLAAIAGAGKFGEMPEPVVDFFVRDAPDGVIGPQNLREAMFGMVFRGYSPEQVDRLLAAAAAQWESERTEASSEGTKADREGLLGEDAGFLDDEAADSEEIQVGTGVPTSADVLEASDTPKTTEKVHDDTVRRDAAANTR